MDRFDLGQQRHDPVGAAVKVHTPAVQVTKPGVRSTQLLAHVLAEEGGQIDLGSDDDLRNAELLLTHNAGNRQGEGVHHPRPASQLIELKLPRTRSAEDQLGDPAAQRLGGRLVPSQHAGHIGHLVIDREQLHG